MHLHCHNYNEVLYSLGETYTICLGSDSSDNGSISWWIEGLNLSEADAGILTSGKALTDSLVNGAQMLLRRQFPHIIGFQHTVLGSRLKFKSFPMYGSTMTIQILHTGTSYSYVLVHVYILYISYLSKSWRHLYFCDF